MEKPKTAIAIQEHLKKGPDYRWRIWHTLREQKLTKMRFNSFLSYFRTLELLGLIVRTSSKELPTPKYKKGHLTSIHRATYFALNKKNLNSEAWLHPERSLHPGTFELTGRGRGRPVGSRNKSKRASSLPRSS